MYFWGVRFYHSSGEPDGKGFRMLDILTPANKNIKLMFHEVHYDDYVVRFGEMKKVTTVAFIVKMTVDPAYPEHIRAFNNAKLVFRNQYLGFWDREMVAKVLYHACVDYVTK